MGNGEALAHARSSEALRWGKRRRRRLREWNNISCLWVGSLGSRARATSDVLQEVAPFVRGYPVGLFIAGLGPMVSNDAYAPRSVWDAFRQDAYHSPRVVWGRE